MRKKSLASKMSPPWDIDPWVYLVPKLFTNGCPSHMLIPCQVLRSYILKPLRKDLASIMSFILSLLIFGGQNVHEWVQTLMSNLCMTSKRWQDYEWRPDSLQMYILWISIPNAQCMQNLGSFCHILGTLSHKKRLSCPPFLYSRV